MEVQRIQALVQSILLRKSQMTAEQNHWRQSYNDPAATYGWRNLIENYLQALEHEEAYHDKTLSALEKEMQSAQAQLKEAYKARRQVEHLKDKKRHTYIQHINKLMEKEMAEMTILRFVHKYNHDENDKKEKAL